MGCRVKTCQDLFFLKISCRGWMLQKGFQKVDATKWNFATGISDHMFLAQTSQHFIFSRVSAILYFGMPVASGRRDAVFDPCAFDQRGFSFCCAPYWWWHHLFAGRDRACWLQVAYWLLKQYGSLHVLTKWMSTCLVATKWHLIFWILLPIWCQLTEYMPGIIWCKSGMAQVVCSRESCSGIADVPGCGFQGSKDPACSGRFWRFMPHAISVRAYGLWRW